MSELLFETRPDKDGDYIAVRALGHGCVAVQAWGPTDHEAGAHVEPPDALPLARAILSAAGVEADVVERVEDDMDALATLLARATTFTADSWRQVAALALARARAIELEPDPAVVEELTADIAAARDASRPYIATDALMARRLARKWQRKEGPE